MTTHKHEHSKVLQKMITLLDINQVMKMLGCLSRTTIYEYMKLGSFPKPIKLSGRMARWYYVEVDSWLENRKQQRDNQFINSKPEKKHEMKRLKIMNKEKIQMVK